MEGPLVMWTQYAKPQDYPDQHVCRKFLIHAGVVQRTDALLVCASQAELETYMADQGLTFLARSPQDEPQIVGVWL